jgi:hypothetical protein
MFGGAPEILPYHRVIPAEAGRNPFPWRATRNISQSRRANP